MPRKYIYRQQKALKSYSLTYNIEVRDDGDLVPATLYSWDSDELSLITHDSAGGALVGGKRYLVMLVSHAAEAVPTSTYNGFYKWDDDNEYFVRDNRDEQRVDAEAMASQTYRLLIVPDTLSSAAEGQPKSDSFGADSLGFQDKDLVRIVNNEGVSYSRTGDNTNVFFRIENIPSKIDRADVMIVVLRADKDKPADYDTLSSGDVAQAYQLRGAFEHDGTKVAGMANWFLNKGTLIEPSRSELFLSLTNSNADGTSLATIDSRYNNSQFTDTRFMLGASAEAVISFTYTRITDAQKPSSASDSVTYGGKTVYKFQPGNALTLDSTGAIPRWD